MTSIGPPVSGLTDDMTCKTFIEVGGQLCEQKAISRGYEQEYHQLICMTILILLILDAPAQLLACGFRDTFRAALHDAAKPLSNAIMTTMMHGPGDAAIDLLAARGRGGDTGGSEGVRLT